MNKNSITSCLYLLLSALFILGSTNIQAQPETKHEIVLVMSHSQSMSISDPDKLARVAALEFIESLDNSAKFGLVYFDGNASIASPLTTLDESRKTVLARIAQLEPGTKQSNSPEAMQKAFEMLTQGSETDTAAQKTIILLNDQPVNTGNTTQDQEKKRWLTNKFSSDTAQKGIKVFSIALTGNADQTLLKNLAKNTAGRYYTADNPQELLGIFRKISAQITGQSVSISPTSGISINTLTEYDASFSPITEDEPTIIKSVTPKISNEQNALQFSSIALVIGLLVAGLLFLIYLNNRGEKKTRPSSINAAPPARPAPEAYLEDIHRITLRKHLNIGCSSTIIGRSIGNHPSEFHYIEIDQDTISREHAVIEYRDNAFYINDKNSSNGTFINDKKVTQWQRLNHLDKVRLDKYEFIFTLPAMQVNDKAKSALPEALLEDATIIEMTPQRKKPNSKPTPQPEIQLDEEDAPTIFISTPKKRIIPTADTPKNEDDNQPKP